MVEPISDAPKRDLASILNEIDMLLAELREQLATDETMEGDSDD